MIKENFLDQQKEHKIKFQGNKIRRPKEVMLKKKKQNEILIENIAKVETICKKKIYKEN